MALPSINVENRRIILLNGYSQPAVGEVGGEAGPVSVDAEKKLLQAIRKDPDAVAFAYVSGRWIPGA